MPVESGRKQVTRMTDEGLTIIRRAVGNEFSNREDIFRRAEIEHARGLMTDEELADYREDYENGAIAMSTLARALMMYEKAGGR